VCVLHVLELLPMLCLLLRLACVLPHLSTESHGMT